MESGITSQGNSNQNGENNVVDPSLLNCQVTREATAGKTEVQTALKLHEESWVPFAAETRTQQLFYCDSELGRVICCSVSLCVLLVTRCSSLSMDDQDRETTARLILRLMWLLPAGVLLWTLSSHQQKLPQGFTICLLWSLWGTPCSRGCPVSMCTGTQALVLDWADSLRQMQSLRFPACFTGSN